jgi:protein-L-isoaspartate(D-aspartate) O-methyltransferase
MLDLPAISRWEAPENLKITFHASEHDQIVSIDRRFLESFSVEQVTPPQRTVYAREGRINYVFAADPTRQTSVVFRLRTERPGLRSYGVGIGQELSQQSIFVFP